MRLRKWRRPGDHPAHETLLLFLEGELTPRDASAAAAHLKQCWSCRIHAEQLGRGIRRFMGYRQDVLKFVVSGQAPPQAFSARLNSVSGDNQVRWGFFQRIPRAVYLSCGLASAVITVMVAGSMMRPAPKKAAASQSVTGSPGIAPLRAERSKTIAVLRPEHLPEPAALVPPPAREMAEAEWRVRLAMHLMDADEGEDLRVEADAWNVIVRGVLETGDRKRQVEDQLRPIAHVVSRLMTVDQAVAGMNPTAEPNQITVSTPTPAFEEELASRFPASGERAAFVDNAIRLSERASSAAFALRALLNRYDDQSAALLSEESRKQLEQVIREHLASMGASSEGFAAAIRPLVEPSGSGANASQETWRGNLGETASLALKIHEQALEGLSGTTAGRSADTVRDALSSDIHALDTRLSRARRDLQQPFLTQN